MSVKPCIAVLAAVSLFSNIAFGNCAFDDLKHNADGTVTYSNADHVCVGNLVQDDKTKTQQVQDLTKAITLKDLAITKADARAQLWQDTDLKLEQNIQNIDKAEKTNQWMYFLLGVLSVVAAGVAANQVSHIR